MKEYIMPIDDTGRKERRMIEPMHLYPDEKERMQETERQGFTVMTCNNWLCPFNNDGYCVSPMKGDECSIYGDKEFQEFLDVVYNENLLDDIREAARSIIIMHWGRKEEK